MSYISLYTERDRQRHKDRQTDRQTDRQRVRERDREREGVKLYLRETILPGRNICQNEKPKPQSFKLYCDDV